MIANSYTPGSWELPQAPESYKHLGPDKGGYKHKRFNKYVIEISGQLLDCTIKINIVFTNLKVNPSTPTNSWCPSIESKSVETLVDIVGEHCGDLCGNYVG